MVTEMVPVVVAAALQAQVETVVMVPLLLPELVDSAPTAAEAEEEEEEAPQVQVRMAIPATPVAVAVAVVLLMVAVQVALAVPARQRLLGPGGPPCAVTSVCATVAGTASAVTAPPPPLYRRNNKRATSMLITNSGQELEITTASVRSSRTPRFWQGARGSRTLFWGDGGSGSPDRGCKGIGPHTGCDLCRWARWKDSRKHTCQVQLEVLPSRR